VHALEFTKWATWTKFQQDIHGEISMWLAKAHGGAIDNSDPSLGWAIKLQNVVSRTFSYNFSGFIGVMC
jgi:hypothetical protein